MACSAPPSARPTTGTNRTWPGGCCHCSDRGCWSCWTGASTPTASLPADADRTGAMLLARARSTRHPVVLQALPDGYLSRLDSPQGLDVRIIEADVAMTGADGTRITGSYRLITTLTDHHRYPAAELIRLYHERWEIESAFLSLRHTLLGGRVLRSGDRPGIEQENGAAHALPAAAHGHDLRRRDPPGTDPDRASFTTALEAARDQLRRCGHLSQRRATRQNRPGSPGYLAPPRRPRYSARKVKCATSRYLNRDNRGLAASPPSPRSASPSAHHAGPRAAPALPPASPPARPAAARPAGTRSPASSSARHRGTGPATNSPPCSASHPETCSPSSAHGQNSASSPAPASAPTGSTRPPARPPRQQHPTLNYAALGRAATPKAPLTRSPRPGQ